MSKNNLTIEDVVNMGKVMPVIVIDDASKAVDLAHALLEGGIRTIEITLRTEAALGAMKAVAVHCPDMVVGAGTILSSQQAEAASDAGARFGVSPGSTNAVLGGCHKANLPLLPGAATVSEMMALSERGYQLLKFFPATAAGGIPLIKSLGAVLPKIRFCPTGGITETTAFDWLSLPNIVCVGGSWIAPSDLIEGGKWDEISKRAKTASQF